MKPGLRSTTTGLSGVPSRGGSGRPVLPFFGAGLGWLLFLAATPIWAHGGRDTITVDGQPLELQLDILEVAPFGGVPEKGKIKRAMGPGPEVVLAIGTGVVLHPDDEVGRSLSRFMGKWPRPKMEIMPGLEWTGQRGFFRVAAGFEAYSDWAYSSTALDDSLYAIAADGAGGLEQWISNFFSSLGTELDTLPLPAATHGVKAVSVAMSFGGALKSGRLDQDMGDARWWAGFHGRWSDAGRGPSDINRVPLEGRPSDARWLGAERNDWEEPRHMDWGVQGGLSWPIARSPWSGICLVDWSGGTVARWSVSLGLQRRFP